MASPSPTSRAVVTSGVGAPVGGTKTRDRRADPDPGRVPADLLCALRDARDALAHHTLAGPVITEPATAGSTGVQALYVSPLKALINDQYGRLDALCEHLEIPVHRWHSDVAGSRKANGLRST